jgi:phage protein U
MVITKSFQNYGTIPSAIISDGALNTIPLWAVTTLSLSQTYHLPPIGSSGARAIVSTHDDTISLNGVLIGAERYTWKLALERLAEASKRGTALSAYSGGKVGGLILITSMTIRTDMQIKSLMFNVSASKRDVIDVAITMEHMPLPSALGALFSAVSVGVGALADFGGSGLGGG